MPPESLPWDRKDFFEEKYERNDSLISSGKWRNFFEGSGDFVSQQRNRDDDAQRQIGSSKQVSYQLFPEDGSMSLMSADLRLPDMALEDENCRFSACRIDGKYSRHDRYHKASEIVSRFSQRDWKACQWDSGDGCVSSSDRYKHCVVALRPVDEVLAYQSRFQSVIENSCDDVPFKDLHDKMIVDGLATGHISNVNFASCSEDIETRIDRLGSFDNHVGGNQCYSQDHSLNSIAWKPLKWTRSSSLSSRGSVLSQATSSKSVKTEFDDRPELPGKVTPVQSPSGDTAVGVWSAAPFEDTFPRKKQRLGWGQGLAKYEKEKVEGPEEAAGRIELVQSANTKAVHNLVTSFPDGSPKLMGRSGCTSPATPSSVACSSSQVVEVEEESYIKAAANVNNTSLCSDSSGHSYRGCTEEFSGNLEHLDLNLHGTVNSLLMDLLQPEDTCSGDSNFGKSISMNKLMSLKNDILKALEKTESEIDLFENELMSLNSEPERNSPCPTALQPCKEANGASKLIKEPNSLDVCAQFPSADLVVPILPVCHETLNVAAEVKDEEIDGSQSVASQQCEPNMLTLREGAADVVTAMFAGPEGSDFTYSVGRKTLEAVDEDGFRKCSNLHESRTNADSGSSMRPQSEADGTLTDLILASNKNSARVASEALAKLFPTDLPRSKFGTTDNSASCRSDDTHIREKIAMKKGFLRFKERVLTLKFRAFHHLWKEDMRLLSIRKYRAKSQKRCELGCHPSHSGFQKHRSSIRARFTSPAGNLTLVPTTEIVDFTSQLLSDSHMKLYRSSLKMPALVLDEKERRHSRFITSNGLVSDPVAVDKERAMINPWTSEEKKVFTEMLATFGKNFSKIASFLNHKTTADCIEFYYKNHKSESFTKIKKVELKKQGSCFPINNYLVTLGKKWHRETNVASLDILRAASVVAAHAEESVKTRRICSGRSILGGYFDAKMFQVDDGASERTSAVDKNDKEAAAADVLAGICGAKSSEAMSSCITSSVDPDKWKCQKKSPMAMGRPVTPEVTQKFDEDDTCSDESCGEVGSVDWTDEEKSVFIGALRAYGRDFTSISRCVGTRSHDQCKIFYSKARKCLGLDGIHQGSAANQGTPTSDANGERSDTEDACVVEMDSVVCSTRSCSMMYLEQPSLIYSRSNQDHGQSGNSVACAEVDESSGMDEKMGLSDEPDGGGKSPITRDCQLDLVTPELGFNNEEKSVNGGESQRDLTPDVSGDAVLSCNLSARCSGDADLFVDMETKEQESVQPVAPLKSVCAEGSKEVAQSKLDFLVGLKHESVAGSSIESFKAEQEQKVPVQQLPQPGSDSRENARTSGLDARNIRSSSFPDSDLNRNGSDSPSFSFVPNYEPQIPQGLLLQKPHVISWQQHQKENCPCVLGEPLVSPDPSIAAIYNGCVNPQDDAKKHHQKSVASDFYRHLPRGCQSFNQQIDPEGMRVLRGFPLRVLNKKEEMNGDADLIGEKPDVIQSTSSVSGSSSQSSQFFVQEFYQEKRDSLQPLLSECELMFLPKPHDKPDDPSKALLQISEKQSSSSEPEEQSYGPGDVKLFGQILTHMPPFQKLNPKKENEENSASLKSNKAFALKFSEQRADGACVVPKLEPGSYMNLKEIPKTTFGFWDGNRIQTGLLSLPDCGMLSKYPAFNANYQGTHCRVEQQPVVKRDDHQSLGLLAFPAKDINNGSTWVDYPLFRSYGSVQALAGDAKRVDMFADMQKRNGFDKGPQIVMAGFQCPSRGVVGMGRGILGLGGGGCVSDPVAAIKKHYADRLQAGIREE